MLYTALGDSITAGEGAFSPARAYPSLVASMLQTCSVHVAGEILAQPGWTSDALKWAVFENSSVYLRQATAISIWIGGDDIVDAGLAIGGGAPKWSIERSIEHYGRAMTTLILSIQKVSKRPIILCTQYNPFPNSPLVVKTIGALNMVTETTADKLHTLLAPAHAWFEGRQDELIKGYKTGRLQDAFTNSRPPVHPNNKGHLVIAQGLVPMIRPFFSGIKS